jgi:hypothetical protein
MVLNALTKIIYSIFRQRYGIAKPKEKAQKKAKEKKPKRRKSEDEDESDFEVNPYISDDSEIAEKTATMKQICEDLDSAQIACVCLQLIMKSSINNNDAVFKMDNELSVTFIERLL